MLPRVARWADDGVAHCGAHGGMPFGLLHAHLEAPWVDNAVMLHSHSMQRFRWERPGLLGAGAASRTFEWYSGGSCSAAGGFGMSA